jgi:hypothetical protein
MIYIERSAAELIHVIVSEAIAADRGVTEIVRVSRQGLHSRECEAVASEKPEFGEVFTVAWKDSTRRDFVCSVEGKRWLGSLDPGH